MAGDYIPSKALDDDASVWALGAAWQQNDEEIDVLENDDAFASF